MNIRLKISIFFTLLLEVPAASGAYTPLSRSIRVSLQFLEASTKSSYLNTRSGPHDSMYTLNATMEYNGIKASASQQVRYSDLDATGRNGSTWRTRVTKFEQRQWKAQPITKLQSKARDRSNNLNAYSYWAAEDVNRINFQVELFDSWGSHICQRRIESENWKEHCARAEWSTVSENNDCFYVRIQVACSFVETETYESIELADSVVETEPLGCGGSMYQWGTTAGPLYPWARRPQTAEWKQPYQWSTTKEPWRQTGQPWWPTRTTDWRIPRCCGEWTTATTSGYYDLFNRSPVGPESYRRYNSRDYDPFSRQHYGSYPTFQEGPSTFKLVVAGILATITGVVFICIFIKLIIIYGENRRLSVYTISPTIAIDNRGYEPLNESMTV